mmetsp:Transcript_20328/g.31073  ORF Transcript_20328/g.31073 Transcript_20328/m.31073 type:complete len:101 (+) Transcript_20328:237-539(+)
MSLEVLSCIREEFSVDPLSLVGSDIICDLLAYFKNLDLHRLDIRNKPKKLLLLWLAEVFRSSVVDQPKDQFCDLCVFSLSLGTNAAEIEDKLGKGTLGTK